MESEKQEKRLNNLRSFVKERMQSAHKKDRAAIDRYAHVVLDKKELAQLQA